MLALVGTILFQVAFALVVRDASHRRRNLYAVGAVNYVLATLFCAAMAGRAGWPVRVPTWVVALGAGAGVSYILSYFFIMYTVQRVGISVPMAVMRMSALVPIFGAVVLYGEHPNAVQVVGIALVFAAFPLLAIHRNGGRAEAWWVYTVQVALLFVLTGTNLLCQKVFAAQDDPAQGWVYLTILFGVAAIGAIVPLVAARRPPDRGDWGYGLALGITNVLANILVLWALAQLPATLVFPVASGAGVVLTTLAAAVFWRESLSRQMLAGIAVALVAVVLINLASRPAATHGVPPPERHSRGPGVQAVSMQIPRPGPNPTVPKNEKWIPLRKPRFGGR